MQNWITDVHTHSKFSFDGKDELEKMLQTALAKGVAFYGASEHFNYDLNGSRYGIDEEAYFHMGRHLQENYAGCMNVLIGAEFGYTPNATALDKYKSVVQKYRPDFIVNSVHSDNGFDYYTNEPYYSVINGVNTLKPKKQAYAEYFRLVKESLSAPYPYDIVGHLGYCARYAPYEDKSIPVAELEKEIDGVLTEIIRRDKILEVNSSTADGSLCVPCEEILQRYYRLGGRKVSFASDTHSVKRIADKRNEVVVMLKAVGFTYITVPSKGEHIQVGI